MARNEFIYGFRATKMHINHLSKTKIQDVTQILQVEFYNFSISASKQVSSGYISTNLQSKLLLFLNNERKNVKKVLTSVIPESETKIRKPYN